MVVVVDALTPDQAALQLLGAALFHQLSGQALLQRLALLHTSAGQVPVRLTEVVQTHEQDLPLLGKADPVSLVRMWRLRSKGGSNQLISSCRPSAVTCSVVRAGPGSTRSETLAGGMTRTMRGSYVGKRAPRGVEVSGSAGCEAGRTVAPAALCRPHGSRLSRP